MVFHGDYEVEFEIYETREGDWRPHLLGHMPGLSPEDAKTRWVESQQIESARCAQIFALFPYVEWK